MDAIHHPPALAIIFAIIPSLSRSDLVGLTQGLIDRMDDMDGDPDLESATDLEDDFALSPIALLYGGHGPGCEVSDQDAGAYVEWHTMRGSQKRGPNILAGHEDAEEDDPAGQADEDGVNTCRDLLRRHDGPGCILSDPDMAIDDRACDGDGAI